MWWKHKQIKVLSPLEGYNRWAATYNQESNPIKNLSDDIIKEFLPDLRGKTVLDAGCGTGGFCSIAEKQLASKVVGIDISPAMIEIARTQTTLTEFRCGSLINVVIEENCFDVIICSLVLGHVEYLAPALTPLLKGLTAGGVLIITDFHPFLTLLKSKRTFTDAATGNNFEVQHHLHLFQEYVRCFTENGVVMEVLEEPFYKNQPVVFGLCARKI